MFVAFGGEMLLAGHGIGRDMFASGQYEPAVQLDGCDAPDVGQKVPGGHPRPCIIFVEGQ